MPEASNLHAARLFAEKYAAATSEKQLGQSFWRDFFTDVIGISDLMSAGIEFEFPVRSGNGKINFIDVLWSGVVLIEHKSAGKDLDKAEEQARDYVIALPAAKRPSVIIVSDFKMIRIIEVLAGKTFDFLLKNLPENLSRLEMIFSGHLDAATRQEISADQTAVELMANLYIEFEKAGFEGHEVSVLLIRILFLNFGDDTHMWKRTSQGLFKDFVADTAEDGMGVGGRLQELFQVLNTPPEKRPSTLSPTLTDFPFVNGGIFKENLPVFSFTADMRNALVKTTEYDWSKISPAIFGSMFQTVKSKEDRRNLGEHYTTEANILKVIRPLFLDRYIEILQKSWESVSSLRRLHKELASNTYLDPACGSGNFLVVSYKRLRDIELKLIARLQELEGTEGVHGLDGRWGLSVSLDQFYGLEINEWSSQIATVAMHLTDHQANMKMEEITGYSPVSFPLTKSAHIHHVNSLQIEWHKLVPINSKTYIMGNPPFIGSLLMTSEQKSDTQKVWNDHKKFGLMDFVTNWFILGARYVADNLCELGFVATNSITQGEQVALLWGELNKYGVSISYAHRTFAWSNEAKGKAAVHVVIMGLSAKPTKSKKSLWVYEGVKAEPKIHFVKNINPYLIDAADVVIGTRQIALSPNLPPMFFGSMPRDNGHLSKISASEAERIEAEDPIASKYLRQLIGATELINGTERFCLWLENAIPQDLRTSPELQRRITAVHEMRLASAASSTREAAKSAHLFVQRAQPSTDYIAVPRVSSESRHYVPMGYFPPEVIASDALLTIPNSSLYVFAVLMSRPFNVWNRTVSGRLKSDTRISQEITYNNFPLRTLNDDEIMNLNNSADTILTVRANYQDASLADLYSPTSMPLELTKAHDFNDKAVLRIFGLKPDVSDEKILSTLFDKYEAMTKGIFAE